MIARAVLAFLFLQDLSFMDKVEHRRQALMARQHFQAERTVILEEVVHASEAKVSLWNVPYGRNNFFTGCEEVLEQLHAALSAAAPPTAIGQLQAISGLGGIGKTQLAVEYACHYRDDYQAVLWARAKSTDLLVSDCLAEEWADFKSTSEHWYRCPWDEPLLIFCSLTFI